mmetsp:Transcript_24678/g.79809  ORF Transcript_24678/g.79809 Transcript_24678/m.79809 type:complete len:85 (+) Transcript_24678:1930-2184(+)
MVTNARPLDVDTCTRCPGDDPAGAVTTACIITTLAAAARRLRLGRRRTAASCPSKGAVVEGLRLRLEGVSPFSTVRGSALLDRH